MQPILPGLYRHTDASHVYVLVRDGRALLIEAGDGSVFERLGEAGAERVDALLLTHHHRDSAGGAQEAVRRGVPVYAPEGELEWLRDAEGYWQRRQLLNNYDPREHHRTLLENLEAHPLRDYGTFRWGETELRVLPTPGHTLGSVTLGLEWAGQKLAFSGDLIAGAGQVWSLAATQWTYNGGEGLAGTILSLLDLQERGFELLLPTHGEPLGPEAIPPTVERLWELIRLRRHNPRLLQLREQPFEAITPHLLASRTSTANYYVLRSESGKALLFDFGYDFMFGAPGSTERAARRPWLYTLPALKKQHGVGQIEAVIPTHYHDDHVAGINLLREQYGTEVWCAENFADLLERPHAYDLPCLWFEPIPVDRRLPLETPLEWEEHRLTLHALPGHTRYAVAMLLEAGGKRVLVGGDQYSDGDGLGLNYVYPNEFRPSDYARSAELYARLRPDLILTGHWEPFSPGAGYFEALRERGEALQRLHAELVPLEARAWAKAHPYHLGLTTGSELSVRVFNPHPTPQTAHLYLHLPPGLEADRLEDVLELPPGGEAALAFRLTARAAGLRRARVGIGLRLGGRDYGTITEALVSTEEKDV